LFTYTPCLRPIIAVISIQTKRLLHTKKICSAATFFDVASNKFLLYQPAISTKCASEIAKKSHQMRKSVKKISKNSQKLAKIRKNFKKLAKIALF